MVKLFLQPVYKESKTQAVIEKSGPILKKALHDYLDEILQLFHLLDIYSAK